MTSRLAEVTRLLNLAADYHDPNLGRDHITGLEHALRVAYLCETTSDELAFVGLVHDLARPLNDVHHGEVIAEIVRDRVSTGAYHVLRTHGEHQAAIMHGTRPPLGSAHWSSMARKLAAAEVKSFQRGCPAIYPSEAEDLLERWLG